METLGSDPVLGVGKSYPPSIVNLLFQESTQAIHASFVTSLLDRRHWRIAEDMWTVRYVKKVDGKGSCGMCDYSKLTIRILQGMSRTMTLRTLFHELSHAYTPSEEAAENAETIAVIFCANEGQP